MNEESVFQNEPLKDFSIQTNRSTLRAALADLDNRIRAGGLTASPIINGHEERVGSPISAFDPSAHSVRIGEVYYASRELASRALSSCSLGFRAWRATPPQQRASTTRKLAALLRQHSPFLTALIIREAGKTWREADADVAEAIDFCEFYASEMLRLGEPYRTQHVLGEDNFYLYQPRGVVAVIAPWNFPLAIACGMTVAALVSGNTVVLKPSEQTSLIAYEFARLVFEAGFPAATFAFLPGRGEDIGRFMVEAPETAMIVFTGSRPVGLEIIKSAATIAPGQKGIKRVVAELGGKNAIIIDEDADFDDAIRGVLQAAFGFAGQKCSACSRLIIVGGAYEEFLKRLASATADLIIGPASDPASFYGPVIDRESFERILGVIQDARSLHVLVQAPIPEEVGSSGWYVPATIFRDTPLEHPIWRDEIFGPVLACARARTFEEALDMANECEYALTGGVFSRNPQHLAMARSNFEVGNLYINRSITGALVCRQPFGGFKFSGVGSKAGGRDYLLQFMEPRTITENTMRRGFTPDLQS